MRKSFIYLLWLFPSIALADISFGLGYSHFRQAPNGQWYQQEYSHDLNMNSPSAMLRYDHGDYSIGYLYTGKVTSNALAKSSDEAYGAGTAWPLSQWYGTGKSEGIFATKRFGNPFYATAGLMAYRSTWSVWIPDWRPALDPPTNLVPGRPQPLTATHKPRWMILPLVGIGYSNGDYSIELNAIPTKTYGDEFPAIYRGYAANILLITKIR